MISEPTNKQTNLLIMSILEVIIEILFLNIRKTNNMFGYSYRDLGIDIVFSFNNSHFDIIF